MQLIFCFLSRKAAYLAALISNPECAMLPFTYSLQDKEPSCSFNNLQIAACNCQKEAADSSQRAEREQGRKRFLQVLPATTTTTGWLFLNSAFYNCARYTPDCRHRLRLLSVCSSLSGGSQRVDCATFPIPT